jgi:hypothetical protein
MIAAGGCDDGLGSEIRDDGSNAAEESGMLLKPMDGLLSTKGWE